MQYTNYAAYTVVNGPIKYSAMLSVYWPEVLAACINNNSAGVIHILFKKEPIKDAIIQFDPNSFPKGGGLEIYNDNAYKAFDLL